MNCAVQGTEILCKSLVTLKSNSFYSNPFFKGTNSGVLEGFLEIDRKPCYHIYLFLAPLPGNGVLRKELDKNSARAQQKDRSRKLRRIDQEEMANS